METLNYSQVIQDVLDFHANLVPAMHAIYDTDRDRYQLLNIGWNGESQIFGCPAYVVIEHGKIWIHRDYTEPGIANQLLEAGVPKGDIILAFHAPNVRQYTDFAVG
jgi:hypothetical protein